MLLEDLPTRTQIKFHLKKLHPKTMKNINPDLIDDILYLIENRFNYDTDVYKLFRMLIWEYKSTNEFSLKTIDIERRKQKFRGHVQKERRLLKKLAVSC